MARKRALKRKAFFVDEASVRRARRTLGVSTDAEAIRLALDRVNEMDRSWRILEAHRGKLKRGSFRLP